MRIPVKSSMSPPSTLLRRRPAPAWERRTGSRGSSPGPGQSLARPGRQANGPLGRRFSSGRSESMALRSTHYPNQWTILRSSLTRPVCPATTTGAWTGALSATRRHRRGVHSSDHMAGQPRPRIPGTPRFYQRRVRHRRAATPIAQICAIASTSTCVRDRRSLSRSDRHGGRLWTSRGAAIGIAMQRMAPRMAPEVIRSISGHATKPFPYRACWHARRNSNPQPSDP